MTHPDDENGDVLRRLEAQGDDLTCSRDIDFTVVFPHQGSAEQFAKHFRTLGHAVSIKFSEVAAGFPWDVVVVKKMTPSHKEIGDFENTLHNVAESLGGRNDGWGCFSVPSAQQT